MLVFLSRVFAWSIFWASIGVGFSCAGPLVQRPSYIPREFASLERARAVEVDAVCANGVMHGGSGVIVGPTHVITARHVVDCFDGSVATFVVVTTEAGDVSAMRTTDVGGPNLFGVGADSARLELFDGADKFDVEPVRYGSVEKDEIVCASTALPNRRRDCGVVQEIVDGRIYSSFIADRGNSGSGLYSERGELVGTVTHLSTCSNGQICGSIANTKIHWFDMVDASSSPKEYQ